MNKDTNYSLHIHHRGVEIKEVLPKMKKHALAAGHFYCSLEKDGKVSFFTNYPREVSLLSHLINGQELYNALEAVYGDDAMKNIEAKSLVQRITTKTIHLTEEQFTKAYDYAKSYTTRQVGDNTEKHVAKPYDDGIKAANFIQTVYHEAGLPLNFTSVYTRSELTNLGTYAARVVLVKYGSKDTFTQYFRSVSALNEIELAMRFNIPKNAITPVMKVTEANRCSFFSVLVKEINLPNNAQSLDTEIQEFLRSSLDDSFKTLLPYVVPAIPLEIKYLQDKIHCPLQDKIPCALWYMSPQYISKGPDIIRTPQLKQWFKDMHKNETDIKIYDNLMLYLNTVKFNEFIKIDEIANCMSINLNQCAEKFLSLLVKNHKIFQDKLEKGAEINTTIAARIKKYFSNKSTEELANKEWQSKVQLSYTQTIHDLVEKFKTLVAALDYGFQSSMTKLVNNFNFLELLKNGDFPDHYNPKIICNSTTEHFKALVDEVIKASMPEEVECVGES